MPLNEPQEVFILFFAIYFGLIIDRSHEMYKPWDTYNAWKGKSHNIRRLLVAWLILFVIPIFHFGFLFILLGTVNIRFDMTIEGISNIILISLSSFFEFGYFRIYEAFLHSYPESFFGDEELIQLNRSGKILPDFWAHFIPGALYVILSTFLMAVAIYY
ncbi:MAG: hypothetical protein WB392_08570 [Methanotrichaceae archaeon]